MSERYPTVKLAQERMDGSCREYISARDAWNHLILPLRVERGHLLCATTQGARKEAHDLLSKTLEIPFDFVLTELRPLEEFIADLYDFEGIDVTDAA